MKSLFRLAHLIGLASTAHHIASSHHDAEGGEDVHMQGSGAAYVSTAHRIEMQQEFYPNKSTGNAENSF